MVKRRERKEISYKKFAIIDIHKYPRLSNIQCKEIFMQQSETLPKCNFVLFKVTPLLHIL